MARSKYPGVGLAAVKKFCGACIRKNKDNRHEYAGLVEESDSYYLVDGFCIIRFRYDLPELIHAEKKEIGGQPSMLYFIENARQKCETVDKSAEIELPTLEEVKVAADMNKAAKKRKNIELPIPLAGGRIWVNPVYLLTMMQIFPFQRIVTMTGNAYQPLYFSCDGADGILMPIRCDDPKYTMERWEDRKAWAQKESADNQPEPEKPIRRTVKRDNMGQPTNLSQLKKRLTVGAAFEIMRPCMETEQRRVITAQSDSICSIVPFDANHRINKCGGSWLNWSKSAYWRFENGLCSVYYTQMDETQTESNLILSIRILYTTPEEDEQYNSWLADLEAQRTADQERKEADRTVQEQAEKEKKMQEIDGALIVAESAIFERGRRVNNDNIHGKCLVLRLAERYNINVPFRTAGWIAKNLASFVAIKEDGKNGVIPSIWVGYSGKNIPQGVSNVLFAILRAVDLHFEELVQDSGDDGADMLTDKEVDRFFNGGIVFPHSDSTDNAQEADKSDSDGVFVADNENIHSTNESANTAVSDADKLIYSKYTQNPAGGHDTAPPLNTS